MNRPPHAQTFSEVRQAFSNHMSLSFESEGFSPLVGRIFALLLFSKDPMSLQELAEHLGVTKAAVSVQVRALERHCMCQKVPTGKDRRDYYYIADDFSLTTMRTNKLKIQSIKTQCDALLGSLGAIGSITQEDRPALEASKRRFMEMSAMYHLLLSRLEGLEEEWISLRSRLLQEESASPETS
ncbi:MULTISPECIES: GbsR/MarR family transcriptional regulator [Paenibacillus]|uniref:GbsR/MarR family transcriptional regulator n=1 Tax=Paenibacillus TaxID=44249 RepID=UPI0022B8E054|nr:MarR family transcriptional regulator [Paenibacillus caseinilyticus]MCZ8518830.1 MarR family transcriptional regulator [Paenibacillus caseinilyticus]